MEAVKQDLRNIYVNALFMIVTLVCVCKLFMSIFIVGSPPILKGGGLKS